MAQGFKVAIYNYTSDVDDIFGSIIDTLSLEVRDLVFTTKNPGGFAECTFRVNATNTDAYVMYSSYYHNFIRVTDGTGEIVWEGRIETITYEPGQATFTCSGLWANTFDAMYDDGSFSGNPGAEHSILNEDSVREFNSTYLLLAQSFQLSEPLAIQNIAVRLTNDGTSAPGEYIIVSLREDSSGSPASTTLATVTIQTETIGTEETVFTGLSTSYRLNADTPYWIVINGGVNTTADSIGWAYDSGAGYTDGSMKYYTSSWAAFTGDAIFYVWTWPRFYYYSVDFENGDFEDNDASSSFDNWTGSAGTGTIAVETSNVYEGSSALKLTAGSGTDTYLWQDFPVVMGSDYTLSFYTRGDGTYAGRYCIWDLTNGAQINTCYTSTGIAGTSYTLVEADFTVPATCKKVRVIFACPSTNGGVAYFDYASLDGDYSSAADVIYDAITQSNFVKDTTGYIFDTGIVPINPIMFTNNERPGDVIGKAMAFGSSSVTPLVVGVYKDATMFVGKVEENTRVWYINNSLLVKGQQALSITSGLDGMKTRVAVLYSGSVGERNITPWVPITALYNRFGYNRDGVYSIAGASEATADILSDVVASAYSKPKQTAGILIGPIVMNGIGGKFPSSWVKAGDKVVLTNIIPSTGGGIDDSDVTEFIVQETSYDAEQNRLVVTPTDVSGTLVDIILTLAGLSGGSMV